MTKIIRVSDVVWRHIQAHATPLADTPSMVLERLLGLTSERPPAKPRGRHVSRKPPTRRSKEPKR